MPVSKVRKEAAGKKVANRKQDAAEKRSRTQAKIAVGTRDWVPWVFIPLGLLGVIWLLVFYIAGYQVPIMKDLASWNYLIGIGLIAASFGVATLWK